MSAPTPSCQARVGSEKNAQGAAMSVQTRAEAKETTTMPADDPAESGQRHEAQGDDEQERPEEVELLLDPERPEVQERGRRDLAAEVVDGVGGEAEVGDVQRRRGGVAGDGREAQAGEHGPRGQRS